MNGASRMILACAALAAGVALAAELPPDCATALARCTVVFEKPNRAPTRKPFRTGRPEQCMPFGAGNLSGMVSFGVDSLEVHLSKADYLCRASKGEHGLWSPGHLSVRFPDLVGIWYTMLQLKRPLRKQPLRN